MTKKSKSRLEREAMERIRRAQEDAIHRAYMGPGQTAGRGQEEFTGDFGAAFDAIRSARERRRTAAYREALDRARTAQREAAGRPPARGAMRPWAVGWRASGAMGRTVMMASSEREVLRRAPRWCLRDAQLPGQPGFEIRYIKELK